MFASAGRGDSEFSTKAVGAASLYVIAQDPDAVYARGSPVAPTLAG